MATHALGPGSEVDEATVAVIADPPDVVIITTDIGLRSWIDAAYAAGVGDELLDVLMSTRLILRGPKARGGAAALGLTAEWTSPGATSGEVLAHVSTFDLENKRIAVQLDGSLDPALCDDIRALGAEVIAVPTYRWDLPDDLAAPEQLVRSAVVGQVDAVTFTARPAVERFMAIAESLDLADELVEAFASRVVAGCVGPVCAEAARRAGFGQVLAPTRFRLGSMVHMLSAHFADKVIDLELAGVPVSLRGRQAQLGDGDVIDLSDREFRVLELLVRQGGVPCSKQSLLSEVWNGATGDTHTVEVTVARLRRRLGPAGDGIETVYRRGYRLV